MTNRIFLTGIPRSGTTWVGKVLSQSPDTFYYHEPDNEKNWVLAYHLKRKLHRYPYITDKKQSSEYYKLWENIFKGISLPKYVEAIFKTAFMPKGKMLEKKIGIKCNNILNSDFYRYGNNGFNLDNALNFLLEIPYSFTFLAQFLTKRIAVNSKNFIIKSVHSLLALDLIEQCFRPKIIIIKRDPLNLIASYIKMRLPDSNRNIFHQINLVEDHFHDMNSKIYQLCQKGTLIQQMALQVAAFYYYLAKESLRHPNWLIVSHEKICQDPITEFQIIFKMLELKWTLEVEKFIRKSNSPGNGFSINRVLKNEIHKWKTILTPQQVKEIKYCHSLFN
jgi:hypothetical protein